MWSLTVIQRYSVQLAFALIAGGVPTRGFAIGAETTPGPLPASSDAHAREPVAGVGYHAGNFIGPLAFDLIIRPLPHLTLDVQAGYSAEGIPAGRLGVAPQLQWEFWRGMHTPYLGVAFRYERVWLDGVAAVSTGGFLVGGWQMRWRSGLGVLFGIGALYKTPVDLRTAAGSSYSDGGLFGTYEIGVRYFF